MDRGDGGFIMHESFKDLKTRRAEQEAYRKALEAQIMEKKRLQEQERERERREYGGKFSNLKSHHDIEGRNNSKFQTIRPPSSHMEEDLNVARPLELQQASIPLPNYTLPPLPKVSPRSNSRTPQHPIPCNRPNSKGGNRNVNDMDNFNEPHPAALAECMEAKTFRIYGPEKVSGVPEIPPECMKYIQQVLPGFTLPTTIPENFNNGEHLVEKVTEPVKPEVKSKSNSTRSVASTSPKSKNKSNEQAFSCGSSSESSSLEDVTKGATQKTIPKAHVSQTSDQVTAGVKISRSIYKADLQKQIDERKKREEEIRQKEQEEEERIQEKIRVEQERMQKEYEEDLRKQQEKEKELEKKRLAAIRRQMELEKVCQGDIKPEGGTNNCRSSESAPPVINESKSIIAESSPSAETIESIGDFFDNTMMTPETKSKSTKYVNPDDRVIPTLARMLKEKAKREKLGLSIESEEDCAVNVHETMDFKEISITSPWGSKETARIETPYKSSSNLPLIDSPMPPPDFTREMAIRSAPSPPTDHGGLEYLAWLQNYLKHEKSIITQRIQARASRSSEKF